MSALDSFDPDSFGLGAPQAAVTRIVRCWESIAWFSSEPHDRNRAEHAFRRFQELGHEVAPSLFSLPVRVTTEAGGWVTYSDWIARVRDQSWSWRFDVTKELCARHSESRGWTPERQRERTPHSCPSAEESMRGLFVSAGDMVVWNSPLGSWLPRGGWRKVEWWYVSYAAMDLLHAIEWQLAEDNSDWEKNPFYWLLCCYRSGYLPFSLAADEVVLFRFHEGGD